MSKIKPSYAEVEMLCPDCEGKDTEIDALRKEVERLGELIAGYKDTLLSVQKQHRRTQARTDAAEAALVEVREFDPASAINSLVTTHYADHHTDESWAALCKLSADLRALLSRAEQEKGGEG